MAILTSHHYFPTTDCSLQSRSVRIFLFLQGPIWCVSCSQAGRRLAAELLPQTLSLSPLSVLYPAVTTLAVLSVISGGGRGERNGEFECRGGCGGH